MSFRRSRGYRSCRSSSMPWFPRMLYCESGSNDCRRHAPLRGGAGAVRGHAGRSSDENGRIFPSMRNLLEHRVLRRAWTGSRLAGSLRVPVMENASTDVGGSQGPSSELEHFDNGCTPSVAARARRNVAEPIFLHCFVGPEIDRYFRRIRPPRELLAEFDIDADFLCPREDDLEMSGRRRAA